MPSFHSWIYTISVHTGCLIVSAILGTLLYYVVNSGLGRPITKTKDNAAIPEAVKALLCSFVGIAAASSIFAIRPTLEIYSPNDEITWMGPFLASTFGFTTFFKSLNVAFGDYPGSGSDLYTWLLWFSMTPEPTFAKGKLMKANRNEVFVKLRDFAVKIIALFIILTILMRSHPPYYRVMIEIPSSSSSLNEDNYTGDGVHGWSLSTQINGFLHLWLLYSFISFCLDFSTISNYAISGGMRMEPGFCNPLLGSRSYKETWGVRWNRPVNALLKRTIYIPARKSGLFNQRVSAMLTFFGSGLLHEYNFAIINHRSLLSPSGYRLGEVTCFFLLMGILMVGESWIWNRCCPRRLQTAIDRLPSAATASILAFMVAGLAERYFLRGWFESGFVEAVAQMLPHMVCK